MKKAIISPPFGNHIERDWATSVKGTYTLDRRWGLWWKVLTTLRKTKGGWINRIGLRNRGLKNINLAKLSPDDIISIAGVTLGNWMEIVEYVKHLPHPIEINASCPNTDDFFDEVDFNVFWMCVSEFEHVIVKIAPTLQGTHMIEDAYRAGVRTFHIGNSFPAGRGAESGHLVKPHTLHVLEWAKNKYPDITVIGGGGIYTPQDVRDYRNAGADHFSLSTIWFTPWKVRAVKEEIYEANGSTY